MAFDLIVRGGEVFTSQGTNHRNLLVKDGKIAAVLSPAVELDGIDVGQVVDAQGQHVFAGMVDLHTHLYEPGVPGKDDTVSGTRAAAAGGVTTVVLMPDPDPPVTTQERVYARAERFGKESFVDFALLGGAGGESLDTIIEQAEAGIVGYKSFLREYLPQRPGLNSHGTGDIHDVLRRVAQTGLFVGFHCEDYGVIHRLEAELVARGQVGYRDYHRSRPEFTEVLATLKVLELSRATGARLHLIHMSAPRAIRLAAQWREGGTDVTVETCPHYLTFSDEDTALQGPYAQVAPPLRGPASREELWQLVADRVVDIVATDHAPTSEELRKRGFSNIFESGRGLPGLETAWPLLLDALARQKLSRERLTELVSETPARIAGLYPEKGSLAVGADADFILADVDREYQFDLEQLYTKNPLSAKLLDGTRLRGRVTRVFQRGRELSREGQLTVDEPIGAKWVTP